MNFINFDIEEVQKVFIDWIVFGLKSKKRQGNIAEGLVVIRV